MNPIVRILLLFLLSGGAGLARDPIETLTLDPGVVVTVPVATNRVTTLSFPGPIAGMDAGGVGTDRKTAEGFLAAHTKGSGFVSFRALRPRASANVNIRWNRRTYVFELVESAQPVLALNLEPATVPAAKRAPQLSAASLLALLDKAKAFPLLKEHHPKVVAGVEFRTFTQGTNRTDFGDFETRLEEVYRFDQQDTLVFRAVIHNRSDKLLEYRPDSFDVRVGQRLYPQSVSEASGQVAPGSEATVYFAITGTPDGGRAELSIDNEFSVLVTRTSPRPTDPVP